MPNELIVEVFKQALPKERWERHRFLASISGTSRLWRQVALSTPFLWTTITLFPACRGELCKVKLKYLRALEIVKLYLERAGQTMLIDLWLDFTVIPPIAKDPDPTIPLLLQNIHRCQSLTLRPHESYVSRIFPLVGNLHSLGDLEVRVDPQGTGFRTFDLTEPSSEIPIELLAGSSIQWESLIHLTVFRADLLACHVETFLCRCPNLISLKCDLESFGRLDAGRITLPHLTLLDIHSYKHLPILPSSLICAPQLLHVRARGTVCDLSGADADFPLLRTLAISLSLWSTVLLPEWLRACPNLTALELMLDWTAVHIIRALVYLAPLAGTILNPALTHLRLRKDPVNNSVDVKDFWMNLERLLRGRPQVSLEFEAVLGRKLKDLSAEFPGRVYAVDDFVTLPPLSDRF